VSFFIGAAGVRSEIKIERTLHWIIENKGNDCC